MMASSHSHTFTRRPTSKPIRRPVLKLTGVIAAFTLTACGSNIPDPGDAAADFAEQLASEELQELQDTTLTAGSVDPAAMAEATAALANYPVTVTLDSTEINDDDDTLEQSAVPQDAEDQVTATANYTVTWDLSGGDTSEATDDSTDEPTDDATADTTHDDAWSYSTQATLIWDAENETWVPHLASDTLVPGLAEAGTVEVKTDSAERGEILDGRDEPLVTDRPVHHVGIDKSQLLDELAVDGDDPTESEISAALTDAATELAEVLDLDADTFVDRTLAAGERAWVEFIVLRDDDDTELPFNDIGEIPGAIAREDTMVLGPTRTFARSLLGTYGEPTAEQIENSDGQLTAGVPTGLTGLQLRYNAELAGTDGLTISIDNSAATSEDRPTSDPVEFTRDATDGTSITATLDTRVQELAEDTIADSDVPAGLAVIRPSDGHILAAADGPADGSLPVAIAGSYPPGSTFKVITALAMLRNGLTADSTVNCPETLNIDGSEIANFDGYPADHLGEITLADAIAQSCNTAFVGQYEDITPEQEHDAAVALGLVPEPITGFDGAFLGSVPTDVEGAEHAAGLFGQGVVETSPLGMATVAASVAAGETVTPMLISEPAVDPTQNENLPGNTPLTEDEAADLRELMSGPVENGTVPILQDVPGAPVLAKTGTAQFVDDGETLAHTWIMAIHGDLAVALFFHEGFAGGQTNGPVLQEFLTELEDIIPSE